MAQSSALEFRSFGVVAAILAVFVLACEPSGPELPDEEFPPDPDLPEAVVDLPDPPPTSAFDVQRHNDDGTLRIEGLIGNRDVFLDEEVEVRATVVDIIGVDCDPPQQRCTRPHFVIRDHPDDDLEMMAVGVERDFVRSIGIKKGEEYVFYGIYELMADGFVSTEDGLISLAAIDDHELEDD